MVLIFSASANGSPQIKREIERAVDKGVYTIPFRIEDVQPTKALEYFISSAHWLDAFSQPLAQHFDSLARTLKAILATPRPGSSAEESTRVPMRSEHIPTRVPEAYQPPAQSPAPPPPPPPPPQFVKPSASFPAPAPVAPLKKTNWTPIIIGILALLLVGGVVVVGAVVYLFRVPASSTAKQEPAVPRPPVTSSPATSKLAPPARVSTPSARNQNREGIPSDQEINRLVLDTLVLFNDAVQAKSFKAFYAKIGPAWKKETSPAQLIDIFRVFVDKKIDFSDIEDVDPTFDIPPAVNGDGWLVAKGHYTLKTGDVLFELKYENDQGNWKLVAINIQTKPYRS